MLRTFVCALVLLTAPLARAQSARPLETRVDPRVELLSTVARLAGFKEFDMENSVSPYSRAVEAHFGPLREHAAVRTLQKLRAEDGVSYDAIASFAVHLDDVRTLAERVDFAQAPERLDARWGGAKSRVFLGQLRDFAAQSKAAEFFDEQRPFYAEVERRLAERLAGSVALPWFETFFGTKAGAKHVAIAGLLCGGGNFGVGVRFEGGTPEELTPVFGCWTFDEQGVPVFGEEYLPLFVHEICHSYTNPFVDRFESELAAAGKTIHASCAARMTAQSYGTWKTMLYESLVRASVVRCRYTTEGEAAARTQAAEETDKGFRWVPELTVLFAEYEKERAKYPAFDAFMPRVVAFFDTYAKELAERLAKAPKVLALSPENGATNVDPALTTIVITFDRAMKDKSWSVVGSKTDVPAITETPRYDDTRKQLTLRVKLEPGRAYRIALNSAKNQGFVSADGVVLEPVVYTFTTRN
jgi:hypothetical protein